MTVRTKEYLPLDHMIRSKQSEIVLDMFLWYIGDAAVSNWLISSLKHQTKWLIIISTDIISSLIQPIR